MFMPSKNKTTSKKDLTSDTKKAYLKKKMSKMKKDDFSKKPLEENKFFSRDKQETEGSGMYTNSASNGRVYRNLTSLSKKLKLSNTK